MPGPGITRPDLCSKRAAASQAAFADTACGPLSADGYRLAVMTRSHRCRIMPLARLPKRVPCARSGTRIGLQARLVISRRSQQTEAGR
jgi:hypothetical protein